MLRPHHQLISENVMTCASESLVFCAQRDVSVPRVAGRGGRAARDCDADARPEAATAPTNVDVLTAPPPVPPLPAAGPKASDANAQKVAASGRGSPHLLYSSVKDGVRRSKKKLIY